MPIQTVNTPAVSSKCPHGAMPAACPTCSGMGGGGGGGGGGASKAKSSSGLMTWNQAYATWNAIQREQAQSKIYQRGVNDAILLRSKESNPQSGNQTALLAMMQRLTQPMTGLIRSILGALFPQNTANNQPTFRMPSQANSTVQNTEQQQNTAGLKLALAKFASVIGDLEQQIEEQLFKVGELIKSVIAELNWHKQLLSISAAAERLLMKFKPKEIINSVLTKVLSWFSAKDKDELE